MTSHPIFEWPSRSNLVFPIRRESQTKCDPSDQREANIPPHSHPTLHPTAKRFCVRSRHNKGENKQFSGMRIREAGRALVGLSERPRHELLRPRNLMQEGLHRRKRPPNKRPHLCPVNGGRAFFSRTSVSQRVPSFELDPMPNKISGALAPSK